MIATIPTRHAGAWLAVVVAGLSAACGSVVIVDAQGQRLSDGSRAVTLTNLHPTQRVLTAVNQQGGELIPVCTPVTITSTRRKRIAFRVDGSGLSYTYSHHGAAAEPFPTHLARFFGSQCPRERIAAMNALDRRGIADGKPYLGMSKEAIVIAMGYPPRHKTPNLQLNTWRYWSGRRSFALVFDASGRLSSANGLAAGALQPPASLAGDANPSAPVAPVAPIPTPTRTGGRTSLPPTALPPPAPIPAPAPTSVEASGPLYSKRVGVVVGINRYERWPSLAGAANDGRRVARFLRDEGFDEVIEIYDGEATRRRMLRVLGTDLPRIADENTLAVIYFAGHGQTETLPGGGQRGYLIPVDGDTEDVFATAISMDTVRDLSKRTPAKHVYYAIDACYSGLAITRGIAHTGGGPRNVYLRKITSVPAVQIITAGAEGEQAIEVGGEGLFTSFLLRALRGEADFNHDGAVTASEVGAYVKPQVTNASRNQQTPQFGTMEGAGEVVFLPRR